MASQVNGRRVNLASFQGEGRRRDRVKDSSKQLTVVLEANQLAERDVPDFLEVDHGKQTAKFTRHPASVGRAVPGADGAHLIVESIRADFCWR